MMRGRLLRRVFLRGIHGARRQELPHVLWIVRLLVGLQYRRPRERLPAQRTPERPLAGVHSTVVLHVMPQLEGLAAELALERPVAGVRRQMGY